MSLILENLDSLSTTATHVAAMAPTIDNPTDGVLPDFTVFGSKFNTLWKKLLGAAWALALIWTVGRLVIALAAMSNSKGGHPQQLSESRQEAVTAGVAVAAVAGFAVIVGAILAVVG